MLDPDSLVVVADELVSWMMIIILIITNLTNVETTMNQTMRPLNV